MKVAIISDYLPQHHEIWSGAELIAVVLANMMKEKDCEVFLLTTRFDYKFQKEEGKIYQVRTPLLKLGTLSRNFPIDIIAIIDISNILRKEKPDVVHINAKYLFLPTLIACSKLNIPVIFTVADYFIFCPTVYLRKQNGNSCITYHGEECYNCIPMLSNYFLKKLITFIPSIVPRKILKLRALLFNYFLKKVDSYIVLSDLSQKRLVEYGISEEKVKVIYHHRLSEYDLKGDYKLSDPSLLFVGWLGKERGVDILIDAFSNVVEDIEEAKLYIVGVGQDSFVRGLKEKVMHMGLNNKVIFLGKRSNKEVLNLIAQSSVVVVPLQWPNEFGPVILVETLGIGKPVIASKIGVTANFIKDGDNGFLVEDYQNPLAFAEKMKFLLSNKNLASEMGANAKESVSFLFDNSPASKMLKLYESICQKSS